MPLRVASVGYLNAKPLVEGLAEHCDLAFDVPSGLLDRLRDGSADVALLPVIDLQREPGLTVLPVGGIGCDGPTLTVRVFSKVPLDRIDTLAIDLDSHTSVALSRVIFRGRYGIDLNLIDPADATPDTPRLLIGDKVVTSEPRDCPHQLDLGGAWKTLTGLPFVFAVWVAREGVDVGDLPAHLASSLDRGLARVPAIVKAHALHRGWPAGIARRYLTEYLKFRIGPRQLDAIRLFHRKAFEAGAIDHEPWPLKVAL